MTTIGDRVLNISLPKIGEKSLFTRDLEDALRTGGVDFVVHSLKDLPTSLPSGMTIGAVLEREDARDALVLRENYKGYTMETLPNGSVVGTSSLRRTAQIRKRFPNLVVCDIRGNLNTRLAKLDAKNSKFAGIVLAQAGLVRMGWHDRISQVLDASSLLYAVGQGALAVECRANDNDILEMLRNLICISTTYRIMAERSFLKTLGGGCSAPVAVYTKINGDIQKHTDSSEHPTLFLDGAVWSLDGSTEIREKKTCSLAAVKGNNYRDSDNANEQPQSKRLRHNNMSNASLDSDANSTFIIKDADEQVLTESYDINKLVEKHIILAKKCPIASFDSRNNKNDGDTANSSNLAKTCPLPIEIGQDVMGQCPFVGNETKISIDKSRNRNSSIEDNPDCAPSVSATTKCPFALMQSKNEPAFIKMHTEEESSGHIKCPFIKKNVKIFDYSDDKKPKAQHIEGILLRNEDSLLCGLYQHASQNRELYLKCSHLGQQLAEDLIQKGALEVMKCAQTEIHSKA